MEEKELAHVLMQQGPFAVLFVWLLWTMRGEARQREKRLHDLVEKLADKIGFFAERMGRTSRRHRRD